MKIKNLENMNALNDMTMAAVAGGYNPLVHSPSDGLPQDIWDKYDEWSKQHG